MIRLLVLAVVLLAQSEGLNLVRNKKNAQSMMIFGFGDDSKMVSSISALFDSLRLDNGGVDILFRQIAMCRAAYSHSAINEAAAAMATKYDTKINGKGLKEGLKSMVSTPDPVAIVENLSGKCRALCREQCDGAVEQSVAKGRGQSINVNSLLKLHKYPFLCSSLSGGLGATAAKPRFLPNTKMLAVSISPCMLLDVASASVAAHIHTVQQSGQKMPKEQFALLAALEAMREYCRFTTTVVSTDLGQSRTGGVFNANSCEDTCTRECMKNIPDAPFPAPTARPTDYLKTLFSAAIRKNELGMNSFITAGITRAARLANLADKKAISAEGLLKTVGKLGKTAFADTNDVPEFTATSGLPTAIADFSQYALQESSLQVTTKTTFPGCDAVFQQYST